MQQQGKVVQWNDERGFGFIAPARGGAPVFVHISAFRHGRRRPALNDRVRYQVKRDGRGRLCAQQVRFLVGSKARWALAGPLFAAAVSAGFFGLLGTLVHLGIAEAFVLKGYALVSALAFVTYGLDKRRAQNGGRRTPEATLHLFALAGGWPGALVAQRLFHHKTSKRPFQALFRASLLFNLSALGLVLFWEEAQTFIDGIV